MMFNFCQNNNECKEGPIFVMKIEVRDYFNDCCVLLYTKNTHHCNAGDEKSNHSRALPCRP